MRRGQNQNDLFFFLFFFSFLNSHLAYIVELCHLHRAIEDHTVSSRWISGRQTATSLPTNAPYPAPARRCHDWASSGVAVWRFTVRRSTCIRVTKPPIHHVHLINQWVSYAQTRRWSFSHSSEIDSRKAACCCNGWVWIAEDVFLQNITHSAEYAGCQVAKNPRIGFQDGVSYVLQRLIQWKLIGFQCSMFMEEWWITVHTLPYWIFATSRKDWGRFGYRVLSCCKRASARNRINSILSSSVVGSFMKDHDVRTGDLPLTCSVILSFHANTAASSLLMASRALCSDFRLRELSISSAELDSAVSTRYSSSPRFAFPDCKRTETKAWPYENIQDHELVM